MQQDIADHYAAAFPGQVQVLGVDLWNGTVAQMTSFQQQTGVTFPLALQGAAAGGGNVELLYGIYDNYIVLNKQGVVRYHAALRWPHGNRYHLNEIRGSVDSLVTAVLDVPGGGAMAFALAAGPNPSRGSLRVSLAMPRAVPAARVSVLDVTGREVSLLWSDELAAGTHQFAWDARDARGAPVPAGLYLVRAALGADVRVRRVSVLR